MSNEKKDRVFQIINLVAVLGAGALLGVIIVQMANRKSSDAQTVEAREVQRVEPLFTAQQTQANPQDPGVQSNPAATESPVAAQVNLSQRARVLATEFRCPCGCAMVLADCTCSKTPGQRDTKAYLQALVDQNKSSEDIHEAMRQRFGDDILLTGKEAAPAAPLTITPTPAAP
jgi:cytochrome c-type biogenesis protein CcmH/NrfF